MEQRPNIIFIMADDLGYADIGCYGRPELSTPNIDRIAARGVRLTQGYANSAVCSATRLALITGRYQYRLPLGLEEPLAGKTDVGLPPEHPTLPSLLSQSGYATALVGKWHLGIPPLFGPTRSGYQQFYGIRSGAVDYYSHLNARGTHDLWDGDEPVRDNGYMTDLLGDRAVAVVNDYAARKQTFLLSLHFNAPHWPWEAPGDRVESDRLLGSNLRHFDGGTQQIYFRMIQAMDLQIGRVLQALDAQGIADDTIVIFTSDNGGERFSDTWPFTGIKTELLEGGLRVPTLICWPARIPAGQVSDQVAITMDWFPTLLEAAGVAPATDYPPDGISLLPMLTGQSAPLPRKLFWRYKTNAQRAARDGDHKYLKIRDNSFLFNVVADPRERANLWLRKRDSAERLLADWHAWNATMLPEIPDSFGETYTAAQLADHIGSSP
jgi:arylsulfatase A-like enzyme